MSSSAAAAPPVVVDDCRGVLQVYSDGSVVRSSDPSSIFTSPLRDDGSVLWKDAVYDPEYDLQLRLYKPPPSSPSTAKLPIFYYFHGGGFCIGSRTWACFHNYCFQLASELHAVVVAPDYRLAPENRLPAAVEDGFAAVKWLQTQAVAEVPDTWLSDVADFDRVFISGDSAGGNIAHNLAVRVGTGSPELDPIGIKGYILMEPFFGGTVLSNSEAEGPKEAFLNWEMIDRYWRLSLPVGETRDHPLVNPFGPRSRGLEAMKVGPILAVVGGSDLLKDRVEEYVSKLKGWGYDIGYVVFEGQQHGFVTFDPNSQSSKQLMQLIKQFVTQHST